MIQKFTAYEMDTMRRGAKGRARESGIPLSEALDQIAKEHAYGNWSLLHKNGSIPSDQPQPYLFRRTPEQIARAMCAVPKPRFRFGMEQRSRSDIARESVQALDDKFISAVNAVDFAIAYVEGVLTHPRFLVSSSSTYSPAYWEMRQWLPYGAIGVKDNVHILVNRDYTPQGSIAESWVDYREYPHLSFRLQGDGWRAFAHSTATQPFLFNDGSTPWSRRQNAMSYLLRLKQLRNHL